MAGRRLTAALISIDASTAETRRVRHPAAQRSGARSIRHPAAVAGIVATDLGHFVSLHLLLTAGTSS